VVVSTVLFRIDRFITPAASVIANPSFGPPIELAKSEKNPECQSCHLPTAASESNVGKKYVAIESGTTHASANG